MASKDFTCKTPDCGLTVAYDPDDSGNRFQTVRLEVRTPAKTYRVALTCANGHTHMYEVDA